MKKILLLLTFLTSLYSVSYAQCTNSITAGIIGPDQIVCVSDKIQRIQNIASPTGIQINTSVYKWEYSIDGISGWTEIKYETDATYLPILYPQSIRYYRRTIIDYSISHPCNTATSNIVKISVVPITAGLLTGSETICVNSVSTPITAIDGTPPNKAYTYQWRKYLRHDYYDLSEFDYYWSTIDGATNESYDPGILSTTTYYKRLQISSDGCGTLTSNVVKKVIEQINSPSVTLNANGNPQCLSLQTRFMVTSTGGGSSPNYQWYLIPKGSGTKVAIGTGDTYSNILQNDDEIYVELVSSSNCIIGVNPFISNKITMDVRPIPQPTINESDKTICAGETFTFTATVGNGTTLRWTKYTPEMTSYEERIISGATTAAYTATQSGIYSIHEDNGTCSTTSGTVTLTVDPCGAFSTTITGPNPVMPGQQNAVYGVPNQTGFTYTWSVTGGTIVSGQNTNAVTVDWNAATTNSLARTTSTPYSISVVEKNQSNQTKTTTATINTITTAVAKSQAQSGINVFPNPTTGTFNIEMPESGIHVTYDIQDLTGLSVASGTFTSTGNDQTISADLHAGMYQIVLTYNNIVTCVRLSKVQ